MRRRAVSFPLFCGLSFGLSLALCAALTAPARAQDVAADDASVRAREHYDRGVGLFDEGRFDAALAEFEAAYALSQRPSILFNVAQMHARLGHAVEATESFERYLAEAQDITAERRAIVERELETQRGRVATVHVVARAAGVPLRGASVSLDDVTRVVDGPLRVSAGEHVLLVRADGHEAARERFRIAGGEDRTLVVDLVRIGAPGPDPDAPASALEPLPSAPIPALTITGAVIGGLGLATWAVAGIVTVLEAQSLTSGVAACSPACPPERLATIDVTRIVADVGLGVLGVGAILVIVGA